MQYLLTVIRSWASHNDLPNAISAVRLETLFAALGALPRDSSKQIALLALEWISKCKKLETATHIASLLKRPEHIPQHYSADDSGPENDSDSGGGEAYSESGEEGLASAHLPGYVGVPAGVYSGDDSEDDSEDDDDSEEDSESDSEEHIYPADDVEDMEEEAELDEVEDDEDSEDF